MIAKIIISANEDETRMGLLENGILMESGRAQGRAASCRQHI